MERNNITCELKHFDTKKIEPAHCEKGNFEVEKKFYSWAAGYERENEKVFANWKCTIKGVSAARPVNIDVNNDDHQTACQSLHDAFEKLHTGWSYIDDENFPRDIVKNSWWIGKCFKSVFDPSVHLPKKECESIFERHKKEYACQTRDGLQKKKECT